MEQAVAFIETEEEIQQEDKSGIEDKVADALRELGYTPILVELVR